MNALLSRFPSRNTSILGSAVTIYHGLEAFMIQKVSFSKYLSKSKTKRLPLNTKRIGNSYYKGNRCRKEGKLTSKGK